MCTHTHTQLCARELLLDCGTIIHSQELPPGHSLGDPVDPEGRSRIPKSPGHLSVQGPGMAPAPGGRSSRVCPRHWLVGLRSIRPHLHLLSCASSNFSAIRCQQAHSKMCHRGRMSHAPSHVCAWEWCVPMSLWSGETSRATQFGPIPASPAHSGTHGVWLGHGSFVPSSQLFLSLTHAGPA